MVDLILAIIFILSLGILIYYILKKSPKLSNFNASSIKKEHESYKKYDLIYQRLERKLKNIIQVFQTILKPIINKFSDLLKKVWHLEKKYRGYAKTAETNLSQADNSNTTFKLSTEIDELIEQKEYPQAEKKIIELITLDPTNLSAYRQLGDLYRQMNDFEQARETFEYVVSLNQKKRAESEIIDNTINTELASDYINLGLALRSLNDYQLALKNIEQACKLESNNPRNLDLLVEISILANNRVIAWEALDRLKAANPENQKLAEFEEKINNLEKIGRIKSE